MRQCDRRFTLFQQRFAELILRLGIVGIELQLGLEFGDRLRGLLQFELGHPGVIMCQRERRIRRKRFLKRRQRLLLIANLAVRLPDQQ